MKLLEGVKKLFDLCQKFVNRKNFKVEPFKKVFAYLFDIKLKNEEQGNSLMLELVK